MPRPVHRSPSPRLPRAIILWLGVLALLGLCTWLGARATMSRRRAATTGETQGASRATSGEDTRQSAKEPGVESTSGAGSTVSAPAERLPAPAPAAVATPISPLPAPGQVSSAALPAAPDSAVAPAQTAAAEPALADLLTQPGVDLSDPAQRARVVATLRQVEERKKQAANQKAERLGFPKRIERPDGTVQELIEFDGDKPIYATTQNINAAISTGANLVQAPPYSVDGTAFTVGIWDGGAVLSSHQELNGRVTVKDGASAMDHATHVAGTVGAVGIDGSAKGMAPNVRIDSYDWNSDKSEMTARGASYPTEPGTIYLSNHSYSYIMGWNYTGLGSPAWDWYGTGTTNTGVGDEFGKYSSYARDGDALAVSLPYYLMFRSAGNDRADNPSTGQSVTLSPNGSVTVSYDPAIHPPGDGVYKGGYDSVEFDAVSKNVLTVGAVYDAVSNGGREPANGAMTWFSSWGPTDDGRIKPDLVANGYDLYSSLAGSTAAYGSKTGTSMSSPNAMGSAALLVSFFDKLFPGHAMRASTLKGLLIHTADDLGTPGPDYQNGWGLMNVKAAADIIQAYRNSPGGERIVEDRLTTSRTHVTHSFTWDGTSPIRATLSWTDPAAALATSSDQRTSRLVNDLDVQVVGPAGSIHQPYVMPYVGDWTSAALSAAATTGPNHTDNVEQVFVANPPAAGVYQVVVSFTGTLTNGAQNFSLILSGGTDTDTAPAPVLTAVSPASSSAGLNATLSLTGANLLLGAEVKLTKTGQPDVPATGVEIFGDSAKVRVNTAGMVSGMWNLVITNPDGQSATLPNAFMILSALWQETLESGAAGWTHSASLGTDSWTLSTAQAHSPTHAFFASGPATKNADELYSPPIAVPANATNLQFVFWHSTDFKSNRDGGVLEFAIDNGPWLQITDAASGASFVTGGYTVTLPSTGNKPNALGGLRAWSGNSGGFTQVVISLADTYAGKTLHARWRLATDGSIPSNGWYVDDVSVIGGTSTNLPPAISTAATATPSPVTGTTTALSVGAGDDAGEAALSYTWTVNDDFTRPVGFGINGTNSAKNTTATFTKARTYAFKATVRDAGGLTAVSSVNVSVLQTLSSIVLAPANTSVTGGNTVQFTATALDQFGDPLVVQPAITWSATGGGTIDNSGLFTSGLAAGGPFTIMAAVGGISASTTVTVTAPPLPPSVTTGAAATITTAGATLQGSVNPNGVATTAQFQYGTTVSYGSTAAVTLAPANGATAQAVSAPVTGLQSGVTYHFRLVASSTAGTTNGTDQTFATVSNSPPTVTLAGATAVGTSGAIVNGTVNPNGLATQSQFEFGTTTAYGNTANLTLTPNSGVTPQEVSAQLSNLAPETVYHYRVTATNSVGTVHTADATFTTATPAPKYVATYLGTPGGDSSTASGVDETGVAVGTSKGADGNTAAFVVSAGNMSAIAGLAGLPSGANGVSGTGGVVGWRGTGNASHAFRATGDSTSDLGTLGGDFSEAFSISRDGQVAGISSLPGLSQAGGTIYHGFRWNRGVLTDIGTFGGEQSAAYGLNNFGDLVGTASTTLSTDIPFVTATHAYLLPAAGPKIDLGTLGGDDSYAYAINDRGQIVGTGQLADHTTSHAFLYNPGGALKDLGTLGGANSYATAINNEGVIVGDSSSAAGDLRAFLYFTGVMYDVNDLVTGQSLGPLKVSGIGSAGAAGPRNGSGINDRGQFTAYGSTGLINLALLMTPRDMGTQYSGALGGLAGGAMNSAASGVCNGGAVVTGGSTNEIGRSVFAWTLLTGATDLRTNSSAVSDTDGRDVSADGSTVVGSRAGSSSPLPFYQTDGGALHDLALLSGHNTGLASGVSENGAMMAGFSADDGKPTSRRAVRWSPGLAPEVLGLIAGGSFSSANAISNDGLVVVGSGNSTNAPDGEEAFRWTSGSGMQPLGDLPGGAFQSAATGVSRDGSVVVGRGVSQNGIEAFRWVSGAGMTGLGDLPGGEFHSEASSVSDAGDVVVGFGSDANGQKAIVWDQKTGVRDLQSVLANEYGVSFAGWTLLAAQDISARADAVCGYATDHLGNTQAFVAQINSRTYRFVAGESYSGFHTSHLGGLGTVVELVGGTAGGIAQTFRTVTADLRGRDPATEQTSLASDVVSLSGTQSDLVVIRISYDEATANSLYGSESNVWPGWFDPSTQRWELACAGNAGGNSSFAGDRAYNPASDTHLGAYGIDTSNNQVWAVVNHGGSFAAITNTARAFANQWRQTWFGSPDNTNSAADFADPDGDGQVNLLERAFGTDPSVSRIGVISVNGGVIVPGSPTTMLNTTATGADYRAIYGRPKAYLEAGFSYAVQFSADLSSWITSTATPTVIADDGVMQAVSVPYPFFVNGKKARFFRVAVTAQ